MGIRLSASHSICDVVHHFCLQEVLTAGPHNRLKLTTKTSIGAV